MAKPKPNFRRLNEGAGGFAAVSGHLNATDGGRARFTERRHYPF